MAQFGSALGSGPRGRRFKSCHSDHQRAMKKILPKKPPDFIGGFAVSTVEIFTSDFADVKKVFFPFCSEPNSRTTEYKPPSAWIRTLFHRKEENDAKANELGRGQTIYTILDGLKNRPMEYDEQIVRQLLECITVHSKEQITVIFVGGLKVVQPLID